MRRTAVVESALGLALLMAGGCGSKAKVTGTPTNKVNAIELGRSLNPDRTVKDPTDVFQRTDKIYASVETETLGSARLIARWTFEDGQTVDSTTESIPASGGIIRTGFHVWKPDGLPLGTYHLQITLDSTVSGVKEFTVK